MQKAVGFINRGCIKRILLYYYIFYGLCLFQILHQHIWLKSVDSRRAVFSLIASGAH